MSWVTLNSNSTKHQKCLKIALQEVTLKLFTDLFLGELSVGKEPSQTRSQERAYQKDEERMHEAGQASCEHRSSRLITLVSYLWKSGQKQNYTVE